VVFPHPGPLPEQSLKIFLCFGAGRGDEIPIIKVVVMKNPNLYLDPFDVARSFSQSANTYDEAAILQREIGNRLLERLEVIRTSPTAIADLGAGTGYFTRILEKRYRTARIYSIDKAIGMLQFAKQQAPWFTRERFVAADAVNLPFKDQSMDFIFSNLTLHWCINLNSVFTEIYRILKPGGFFIFSVMGPDTLQELRNCWSKVDDYPHVNSFVDMHHIGDLLLKTHWSDPVMDMEYITMHYGDLSGLIGDLRMLGAHNSFAGKRKTLTGKKRFKQMVKHYEDYRQDGLLPATYEIIYGLAWRLPKPDMTSKQETTVSIEKIRRL